MVLTRSLAGSKDPWTWDELTDSRIRTLHPDIQEDVILFINRVHQEYEIALRVTDANRSWSKQKQLYARGRTKPGRIVTYARPGQSYHNYGLAFDICEIKNGTHNWDIPFERIVPIAKELEFEWGGDWARFKDRVHFQKTMGYSIKELRTAFLQQKELFR